MNVTVNKSLDVEVVVAITISAASGFVILFPSPGATLLGGWGQSQRRNNVKYNCNDT